MPSGGHFLPQLRAATPIIACNASRVSCFPPSVKGKFFGLGGPPAAHFSQQLEKWAKKPFETDGFKTSFPFKSRVQYGPVKGIDSATDPLPLPLRRRGVWVYGWEYGFPQPALTLPVPTAEQKSLSTTRSSGSVSRSPPLRSQCSHRLWRSVPHGRASGFFNCPRSGSVSRNTPIPCFGGI